MVLAASKRDELTITVDDMSEALTLITDIESDMQHVFSSIGVSHSAKVSNEILTLIKNHGKIDLQSLWRLCYNTTAQKDFAEGVKAAVDAGYVKVKKGDDGVQTLSYAGNVTAQTVAEGLTSPSPPPGKVPPPSDKGH
jgi:hypothetical protein